jgi:hypothetical protein
MNGKKAYKMMYESIAKMDRMSRIGFLLGAIDDGMFDPPDGWQMASDDQLAHWGVEAFTNAAEHIVKGGKPLPSETRGPKPFGVA